MYAYKDGQYVCRDKQERAAGVGTTHSPHTKERNVMDTIVAHPRHDDGTYAVRMAAQADAYVEDLNEVDEAFDLACEIQDSEGCTFREAYRRALQQLPGCAVFAQDWDAHAWLAGNEVAAVF
jgi:hypothetical protein